MALPRQSIPSKGKKPALLRPVRDVAETVYTFLEAASYTNGHIPGSGRGYVERSDSVARVQDWRVTDTGPI